MRWYVRPASVVALARRASYVFVVADRPAPICIDDIDVDAMAQVLELAARPISHDALAEISSADAIAMLLDLGVLVETTAPSPAPTALTSKRCKRMVLGLTGSVAVAGALDHVIALADGFAEHIDIVISEGAQAFVVPRVYEYYGFTTWRDMYAPAHGVAVPHKHLAAAELVLIAPASATTLQRIASGACSDLLSLVVAMTTAPVVVAPSMNAQMWRHPPIQRNVAQLRADGIWVIEPGLGKPVAARGEVGVGGGAFDIAGLLRGLAAILDQRSAEQ